VVVPDSLFSVGPESATWRQRSDIIAHLDDIGEISTIFVGMILVLTRINPFSPSVALASENSIKSSDRELSQSKPKAAVNLALFS
jgi:hypothetical protein